MASRRFYIIFSVLTLITSGKCINYTRPAGFKFGVATASYQIEGGWNQDGKGENIWDRYTHTQTSKIKDKGTGDIACNSYNLWQKDVEMLDYLGVDFYRFSISWSRILPGGFPHTINKAGVAYYNNLIDALVAKKIEPVVTLYHWDLPQPIQDLGGWTNSFTSEYFAEYARMVFGLFGDRVKTWITINEPSSICVDTYEFNNGAPGIQSPGIGSYLCGKNVLLAHAKAYRLYREEFLATQNGKVGITIDSIWAEPKSDSLDDQMAADREMQMSFGWFANPIFTKSGDYPKVMAQRIAHISAMQNFSMSRLPVLQPDEIRLIQGSADFLGLNHYHTWLISRKDYPLNQVSFVADRGTQQQSGSSWKDPEIVPWGLTKLLNWIKDKYYNPLVYITENGLGDSTGTTNDSRRIQYIQEYVNATFQAANNGSNVVRYTVWSLMDNMEWTSGYTVKFGLYYVDFHNPNRPRTLKESGAFYKGLIF